jgi:hypothetical protein
LRSQRLLLNRQRAPVERLFIKYIFYFPGFAWEAAAGAAVTGDWASEGRGLVHRSVAIPAQPVLTAPVTNAIE